MKFYQEWTNDKEITVLLSLLKASYRLMLPALAVAFLHFGLQSYGSYLKGDHRISGLYFHFTCEANDASFAHTSNDLIFKILL